MIQRGLGPVAVAACVAILAGCGSSTKHTASRTATPAPITTHPATTRTETAAPRPAPPVRKQQPPFAVGLREVTFVDHSRTVQFPGSAPQPRTLETLIRYPTHGRASDTDLGGAPPARADGPFPLIIFGHGFNVTPEPYASLLRAWTRAGYIVAAPIFPLENANAPGGANENDLVNQPRDMSFLITSLLALSAERSGFLSGLIEPNRVAVTGQSDGGETALAVAYNRYFLDRRVDAAVILSGAKIPGVGGFDFPSPSPPLLATQGTADTINPPSFTYGFYDLAPPPKYLLRLFGAPHLPPYTYEQPQLGIVERTTVAFLDRYLKGEPRSIKRAGDVPGLSEVSGEPR
jgi:dienelactone hydrolase